MHHLYFLHAKRLLRLFHVSRVLFGEPSYISGIGMISTISIAPGIICK